MTGCDLLSGVLLLLIEAFGIFRWGHAGFVLEELGKIVDRVEAQLLCDLGKAHGAVADHFFGGIQLQIYEEGNGAAAALLLKQQLQFRYAHGAALCDLGQREVLRQMRG